MGLLTANKWQPSVLQLLPFSNNNVGVKRHPQGVPSATYSESGVDREFPLLAVTRSENARPRSKSANVPSDASLSQAGGAERKFGQGQQRRLFRASSERLARGADRTSIRNGQSASAGDKHKNKLRARSDYGISTFYKRPEVVKISVNDINEQILGKNRVRSALTANESPNAKICESPNGVVRMKLKDGDGSEEENRESRREVGKGNKTLLPKSALKPTPGRWPNSGLTFWSSATTVPNTANVRGIPRTIQRSRGGEIDTSRSREASSAPAEVYFRKDGRRVKLNVNELPRSKTPIADNDPDKLNMQHVIAFLQSSSSGDENDKRREVETVSAKMIPGQLAHSPIKRSAINGVITASPDQNGLVSIRPSQVASRAGSVSPEKVNRFLSDIEYEITPHRLSFNKTQLEEEKNNGTSNALHGKAGAESMELYRKTRTSTGGLLNYSEFKTHSVSLGEKPSLASSGYPNLEDIHIPLSIRKIRDSTQGGDAKPFRLHRFLTLVSNGPEMKAPEKIERSAGGAGQSKNFGFRDKRRAFRKGSGSDKTGKGQLHQKRSHPDSNLYYLDVSSPFNDRPRSKGESRGSSNSRQEEVEAEQLRKDVQRVIRLPRAHFEADSDEESSPYCTVPAARNKRALTLSAQGKAIKNIFSDNSNNNKLSLAQHHADKKSSQKGIDPKDRNTNIMGDSANSFGKNNAEQNIQERIEGAEVNVPQLKDDTYEVVDPVIDCQENKENGSEKSEITTDKVSAVTFRDVLGLRSEPGANIAGKDSSSAITEHGSTTFLTQAPSSSSPPHYEQNPLSPSNADQQTNNASKGSPVSKREGGTSGSTPSPTRDHVKLSLRKEKNKTRELTYMFQVDHKGMESFSPSPK